MSHIFGKNFPACKYVYVAVVCCLLLSAAISILYIPPQFIVRYKVAPYKNVFFHTHAKFHALPKSV